MSRRHHARTVYFEACELETLVNDIVSNFAVGYGHDQQKQ
jgi:hypothetical protein